MACTHSLPATLEFLRKRQGADHMLGIDVIANGTQRCFGILSGKDKLAVMSGSNRKAWNPMPAEYQRGNYQVNLIPRNLNKLAHVAIIVKLKAPIANHDLAI